MKYALLLLFCVLPLMPLAALHAADAAARFFDLQGNALEADEAAQTYRERSNMAV